MAEFICILPQGNSCANCADESWWYRGEKPTMNDKGILFCEPECADEWDRRYE